VLLVVHLCRTLTRAARLGPLDAISSRSQVQYKPVLFAAMTIRNQIKEKWAALGAVDSNLGYAPLLRPLASDRTTICVVGFACISADGYFVLRLSDFSLLRLCQSVWCRAGSRRSIHRSLSPVIVCVSMKCSCSADANTVCMPGRSCHGDGGDEEQLAAFSTVTKGC